MKHLLTIFCLVLLVSCSKEVPSDKLVFRNGFIYEINSTVPFTGSSVDYHDNGQLSSKGNYKDGKRDGLVEGFHENGQLRYRRNFKDGELDGLFEWFHKNGQLRFRGNYKNGKREGLWESFDEEGNLTKTKEYKNGELING